MANFLEFSNDVLLSWHFYQGEAAPAPWIDQFPSPSRARDFYNSRMALLHGLQESEPIFNELTIDKLEIENHTHLKDFPEYKVSLSHSRNTGAAIFTKDSSIRSVGIDIELISRPIKAGIEHYLEHPLDLPHSPLQLWVIKEACFKAAAPFYQQRKSGPLVLKDFWVKEDCFGLFEEQEIIGRFALNIEQHFDDEFWVAKAWLEK